MRTDGTDDPGGTSGFRLMNWALGAGRLPPTGMRGPITLGEHRGLQLVARPCNWLIGKRKRRNFWELACHGLFVPKPNRGVACQCSGTADLASVVC